MGRSCNQRTSCGVRRTKVRPARALNGKQVKDLRCPRNGKPTAIPAIARCLDRPLGIRPGR